MEWFSFCVFSTCWNKIYGYYICSKNRTYIDMSTTSCLGPIKNPFNFGTDPEVLCSDDECFFLSHLRHYLRFWWEESNCMRFSSTSAKMQVRWRHRPDWSKAIPWQRHVRGKRLEMLWWWPLFFERKQQRYSWHAAQLRSQYEHCRGLWTAFDRGWKTGCTLRLLESYRYLWAIDFFMDRYTNV